MIFKNRSLFLLASKIAAVFSYGDNTTSIHNVVNWEPCDLDFPESLSASIKVPIDCATLEVPLDYTDPNSEPLQIQLIKVNATKQPAKSILFNPGGPGASGVEDMVKNGPKYTQIFQEQYNLIGFDPRGTGKTIPFRCIPPNATTGAANLARRSNGTIVLPQREPYNFLNSYWEQYGIFAELCYESNKKTGNYLSSAFVARDVLRIINALNEDGLLRFWGLSYGTILGQTFAAMFPDRIDRMLLDSVVIPEQYYSGYWIGSTRNSGAALEYTLNECVKIGSEICPLANYSGPATTAQGLMTVLSERLQELLDGGEETSGIHSQVMGVLRPRLYDPIQMPTVTRIVERVLHRDWEAFAQWNNETQTSTPESNPWNEGADAFRGIGCAESSFRRDSMDDVYGLVRAQQSQGMLAEVFEGQMLVCSRWKFKAAGRYEGGFKNINTSFPLMFVNSPYDPVTALSGAFEASAGFPGSRLLIHNGFGHGAASHRSDCTEKAIFEYFKDGTLPNIGDECEPNKPAYEVAIEEEA